MYVNTARTVSEALHNGLHAIRIHGISKLSRVGVVMVAPHPVMTVYQNPTNRVLFSPMRDANPFFHVMESLWMLAGRNDLPWLTRFNKKFAAYSDDGGATQPGAYGYRWRNYFGHDQLMDIILELKQNPDSRRIVLAMWDGGSRATWAEAATGKVVKDDLSQPGDSYAAAMGSADVPCNTHAYFDTIDDKLNMTVCCRSNDIIWGAYGANAVHFSFLLEFLSSATGIPMGIYRQFSNNFHLYTNVVPRDNLMAMARDAWNSDKYLMKETANALNKVPIVPPLRQVPLMQTNLETWEAELQGFMDDSWEAARFTEPFFRGVALPVRDAHAFYRDKRYDLAIEVAETIKAEDWRIACVEWLKRRQIKYEQNQHRFTEVTGDPLKEVEDGYDAA